MFVFMFSLVGCSKKDPAIESSSTEDFGEVESTSEVETTEDIFAVDNTNIAGYEIRETTKFQTEILESAEVVKQQALESASAEYAEESKAEQEYFGAVDSNTGETYNVLEIENYSYDKLVTNIKNKQYDGVDLLYADIDTIYENYPKDVRDKLKGNLKEVYEYWEIQYKAVENQERPWTEEELAENPDLAQYTREEVEEINRKLAEMGFVVE